MCDDSEDPKCWLSEGETLCEIVQRSHIEIAASCHSVSSSADYSIINQLIFLSKMLKTMWKMLIKMTFVWQFIFFWSTNQPID